MPREIWIGSTVAALVTLAVAIAAFAQPPAEGGQAKQKQAKQPPVPRPPLFFREEWRQPSHTGALTDANRRLTPEAVTNPNLELKMYGACKEPGVGTVEVYGAPKDSIFPTNLWTGMCASTVAITLRDKNNYVDLTGPARIRWVTRAANLHAVRPVLKLADGTLIVGNHIDVTPNAIGQFEPEMVESEFSIGPNRWYVLNAETVATTKPADNPDLSRVDEVGFADLMPGGGHGSAGWINVGPFEVYGKPIKR
jgi:hypothetical protein